jgi:YVTN family beta-propeller protein
MTAKTSPGRFLRRRSFHFAGTRNWLLAVGVFVLVGAQASAFTAYVSNEKSNTISVVDTDKFTVVKTIKVGQRPRGIELTKDGKFILVAVGDDDTIQVIDVRTHEIVALVQIPSCLRRITLARFSMWPTKTTTRSR